MKTITLRILALCLACVLLLLTCASCTGKTGKPLLTLEKDGISVSISVNVYQLMLTRMKGSLAFYGYTSPDGSTPDKAGFWEWLDKHDGTTLQTADEFYCDAVLDSCRSYLVALYLFEKEGLSLSAATLEQIETDLEELIRTDGNGSKTKLNALLATYGANYDILKEAYLIEAKADALREHLYGKNGSKLGTNIKDEYLEENYVHFRQILFTTYRYVYEKDANGDTVYYYSDEENKGRIFYDVHNGVIGYDENGAEIKDKNGDTVYYVKGSEQAHIAYNKTHGEPVPIPLKDGSGYEVENMTEEELAEVKTKAEELYNELQGTTQAVFEAVMEAESDDMAEVGEYEDGYYLPKNLNYAASGSSYAYLSQLVSAMEELEEGEITLVKSDFGYHIVRKYAHSDKAYDKEENKTWFSSFYSGLIEQLFMERCEEHANDISLDEALLATAPSMKEVGINYYY